MIDTSSMTHHEWVAIRKAQNKIGGSEIGTIIGVNPYQDPITLWYEKIGWKDKNFIPNKYTAVGHVLEDKIVEMFSYYEGGDWIRNYYNNLKVRRCESIHGILFNEKYPWMAINIDTKIVEDMHYPSAGIGEIKTIGGHAADKYRSGVPPQYPYQLNGYMMGCGAEYGYIVLFKDNKDLVVRPYEKDLSIEKEINEVCSRFYEAMDAGQQIVNSNLNYHDKLESLYILEETFSDVLEVSAHECLQKYYTEQHIKAEEKSVIDGDPELLEWALRYSDLDQELKKIKAEKDLTGNLIRQYMKQRFAWKAKIGETVVQYRKQLRIKKA